MTLPIWGYLVFFVSITAMLILLDLVFRDLTERNVVKSIAHGLCFSACMAVTKNNISLYIIGSIILIIVTDMFLISKLYPTKDSTFFTRRKENAVSRNVRGEEESDKDLLENEGRSRPDNER